MPLRVTILAVTIAAAALGAASPAVAAPDATLHRTLDKALADTPLSPGMIAAFDAPGLRWRDAVGVRDRATRAPLRVRDSYRLASVTKTFTAAAVLRLVEQRKVALDAPITRYLPAVYRDALRGDGYKPRRITVRMLLQHTAGLWDYAASEAYAKAVFADFEHRWTPLEQVRFAMEHGDPLFAPARGYQYSDTGYVLLGRIVERVSGRSQAKAYRRLLRFDRIGLRHTYFETLEPAPAGTGPRAHQYYGDVDTYYLDASHDLYGGGGYVSTVADQNRFFRALFAGKVVRRRTLKIMTAPSKQSHGGYGMGIGSTETAAGTCYGHGGFWGAVTLYCPDRRLVVSVTVDAAPPAEPGNIAGALIAAALAP
jgi:D-alanyl-D-alanine carboxypeptidase